MLTPLPELQPPWSSLANVADVPSPALLLDHATIERNLQRMLAIAGSPDRLRPHLKTHKLPQLVTRQRELGITRFKCATIAEAEMAAMCGAPDVLLAMQPVGPNAGRLAELVRVFPATRFSALVDDPRAARELGVVAHQQGVWVDVLLDLDVGQHRSGRPADVHAGEFYASLAEMKGIQPAGLHAYDGHLMQSDCAARETAWAKVFRPVFALREELTRAGLPVPRLVCGGTPTFPFHARTPGVECSPGTCVLWDAGYAQKLPDLDFEPAAWLLTRVVSKPLPDRLCLDLGHKAVAAEMTPPRVLFPALPGAEAVTHSEEHLVLETPDADQFAVGDVLFGVPWHVCPTVALHAEVWLVEEGRVTERWEVAARARRLTV